MRDYQRTADRSNKLVHERGFKGSSVGKPAGHGISLRAIDRDTRNTLLAMLSRGLTHEQICYQTGATPRMVRLVELALKG